MSGLYIFGMFIVVEIITIVVTAKKRNLQTMFDFGVKSIMISMLILSFLLKVLTWGFRYYTIVVFLLVLLLFEGIKVLRKHQNEDVLDNPKKMRNRIYSLLLLLVVLLPAIIFPEYQPLKPTGEYEVLFLEELLIDEGRLETFDHLEKNRQIPIKIWYPSKPDEKMPLVVYSHGGISLDTSNESLFLELASHGYMVASIAHPFHSILTKDEKNQNVWIDLGYMGELTREDASADKENSFELYQKWMKIRTDDIDFVIEHFKTNVAMNVVDELYQMMNIEQIAVIGHSLGGSAALCIGRNRDDIDAVIALESPFMCDIVGVKNNEFVFTEEAYALPVFQLYTDSTWDSLSKWPQYAQNVRFIDEDYEHIIFHKYLSGTGHFSLTDLSLSSPLLNRLLNGFGSSTDPYEVLRMVNQYCLEFLDRYLPVGVLEEQIVEKRDSWYNISDT